MIYRKSSFKNIFECCRNELPLSLALLFIGACAATRESIEWNLTKEGVGNALILVVGGAAEALDAHPGMVSLVLKKRKGFIRLALKYGYTNFNIKVFLCFLLYYFTLFQICY